MTYLEIQEQAERLAIDWHYPDSIAKGIRDESGEYYSEFETTMHIIEIGLKAGAKWMQEQDKWISVETSPMKPNGVSELYVLASEDEDCLTVEKVFYDTKDNTYWIPFCKEQYFPKWYCYLPSPPKTK